MTFFESIIEKFEKGSKPYTVEKHGSGWAIYAGRDIMHHGANLGHLTETTDEFASRIEDALNLLTDREANIWDFKKFDFSGIVEVKSPDGQVFSVQPSELSPETIKLFNAMADALIGKKI